MTTLKKNFLKFVFSEKYNPSKKKKKLNFMIHYHCFRQYKDVSNAPVIDKNYDTFRCYCCYC